MDKEDKKYISNFIEENIKETSENKNIDYNNETATLYFRFSFFKDIKSKEFRLAGTDAEEQVFSKNELENMEKIELLNKVKRLENQIDNMVEKEEIRNLTYNLLEGKNGLVEEKKESVSTEEILEVINEK